MVLISVFTLAVDLYEKPSSDSHIISKIDPEHQYTIQTQDWVEVHDETSNQSGWAKLSELKTSLSSNSQWSYRWNTTDKGSQQIMHYKPFNAEEISRHVQRVHKQHKKIMADFQSFWDEIDHMSGLTPD